MSLSSHHFLVRIEANVLATNLGGLYTLTLNDCSTWLLRFLKPEPHFPSEFVINAFPCPILQPLAEIPLHRGVRWKITGEHVPLTARFVDIEEGIDDTAETDHTWSTEMCSYVNERSNDVPFCLAHIRRILGSSRAFVAHIALHQSRRLASGQLYHSWSILC